MLLQNMILKSKIQLLPIFLILLTTTYQNKCFSQNEFIIQGIIKDSSTEKPIDKVQIFNLNNLKLSQSNPNGNFQIKAKVKDTLNLNFLGYENMQILVTKDWIKQGSLSIYMTASAIALRTLTLKKHSLTGHLETDIQYINNTPNNKTQYIKGTYELGYETGHNTLTEISDVLSSITNPLGTLHRWFSQKGKELKKLKKLQQQDQSRQALAHKHNHQIIGQLLKSDRQQIYKILGQCNYSVDFIEKATDLQLSEAIVNCYESFKNLQEPIPLNAKLEQ